ncbi:glycerol-3-phosphate dehydrogenase/oxidase [Fodinicola acaciae]|uniref:glycerol-3-phosphate dehydrogenase/oxidase n=1 Tax=Fodinicola acaciae TaxID=2681555 RepID=UPI0013D67C84|nr:glycerol-3-phosphate dehydrogenase/oxidase [Fodinicola acaciae]
MNTALNANRRAAEWAALAGEPKVDVLVVGGGVTGTGVALDAASRGLSVVLAERHDLAFGTSRWSSKLVHGGLRYLASGQVGVAYESAVERGLLMRFTAPHLVRALPQVTPVFTDTPSSAHAIVRAGTLAGDLLRTAAGTPVRELPRSRHIPVGEVIRLVPGLRRHGLRGGVLSWDGQLTDDARLVVAIARTAAGHGAKVLTRCAAEQMSGNGAVLRDTRTGDSIALNARVVINATGVWAAENAPDVSLRPSRGTHLVLPDSVFGGLRTGLTIPVPAERNRFVIVLPQVDDRVFVGLTDEPADGPIPDVPEPTEAERAFLLKIVNSDLDVPVRADQVLGAYAGLRPLLDSGAGRTADLSRRHAVLRGETGVITVVGGKLTTYRRMAEDAVDAAVRSAGLTAGPCRTRRLPLVGAAPRVRLEAVRAPRRLVDRYGIEAPEVAAMDGADPVAAGQSTTMAEFVFALRREGALTSADLLDRRTRIGLVAADRAAAEESADRAVAAVLAE